MASPPSALEHEESLKMASLHMSEHQPEGITSTDKQPSKEDLGKAPEPELSNGGSGSDCRFRSQRSLAAAQTLTPDNIVAGMSLMSIDETSKREPPKEESQSDTGPSDGLGSGGSPATSPLDESQNHPEEEPEEWEATSTGDDEEYPPAPPPSPASNAGKSRTRRLNNKFFAIRPSKLGGLGAFAIQDLKRGETILVERPLLRTTHFRLMRDFYSLSKSAKAAYLRLHGGEGGDAFSRVERIKQLNSFQVPGGLLAIFEIASRFNHACGPVRNVDYVFDSETGVLSLTVCQDVVAAGAELFIDYGGSPAELYMTYGFQCTCGGCGPLTDEDMRRPEGYEYGIVGEW